MFNKLRLALVAVVAGMALVIKLLFTQDKRIKDERNQAVDTLSRTSDWARDKERLDEDFKTVNIDNVVDRLNQLSDDSTKPK